MYRKDIKNANGLIVAEETKSRFSRLNMYIFQADNIVQILTSCLLYWVINTRGFNKGSSGIWKQIFLQQIQNLVYRKDANLTVALSLNFLEKVDSCNISLVYFSPLAIKTLHGSKRVVRFSLIKFFTHPCQKITFDQFSRECIPQKN